MRKTEKGFMKKAVSAAIIAAILIMCVAGCGNANENAETESTGNTGSSSQENDAAEGAQSDETDESSDAVEEKKVASKSGNVLIDQPLSIMYARYYDEEAYSTKVFGTVEFLDTLEDAPSDAADLSAAQDGSVMMWRSNRTVSGETVVDLYIAGEGGVDANEISSYYFENIEAESINFNGNFYTGDVTSMRHMFDDCVAAFDVEDWDTSNVTDMSDMFEGCEMTELDLSGWDTSKVTDMSDMFKSCKYLETLDVSTWDVSNVTDMTGMFSSCFDLKELDLSGWNVSAVTSMSAMFYSCSELESLDLGNWDTSCVTDMSQMFEECRSLITLDISGWDTSNVTRMDSMFDGCAKLEDLKLGEGFVISEDVDTRYMFNGCSMLSDTITGMADS